MTARPLIQQNVKLPFLYGRFFWLYLAISSVFAKKILCDDFWWVLADVTVGHHAWGIIITCFLHSRNCYYWAMIVKGCVIFERTLLSRKKSHNLAWSWAISKIFYCVLETSCAKNLMIDWKCGKCGITECLRSPTDLFQTIPCTIMIIDIYSLNGAYGGLPSLSGPFPKVFFF